MFSEESQHLQPPYHSKAEHHLPGLTRFLLNPVGLGVIYFLYPTKKLTSFLREGVNHLFVAEYPGLGILPVRDRKCLHFRGFSVISNGVNLLTPPSHSDVTPTSCQGGRWSSGLNSRLSFPPHSSATAPASHGIPRSPQRYFIQFE